MQKPDLPVRFRGFNLINVRNGTAYIDCNEVVAVVDDYIGEDYRSCVVHLRSGGSVRIAGSAYHQLRHLFREEKCNESA